MKAAITSALMLAWASPAFSVCNWNCGNSEQCVMMMGARSGTASSCAGFTRAACHCTSNSPSSPAAPAAAPARGDDGSNAAANAAARELGGAAASGLGSVFGSSLVKPLPPMPERQQVDGPDTSDYERAKEDQIRRADMQEALSGLPDDTPQQTLPPTSPCDDNPEVVCAYDMPNSDLGSWKLQPIEGNKDNLPNQFFLPQSPSDKPINWEDPDAEIVEKIAEPTGIGVDSTILTMGLSGLKTATIEATPVGAISPYLAVLDANMMVRSYQQGNYAAGLGSATKVGIAIATMEVPVVGSAINLTLAGCGMSETCSGGAVWAASKLAGSVGIGSGAAKRYTCALIPCL